MTTWRQAGAVWLVLVVSMLTRGETARAASPVVLQSTVWTVEIAPETLAVTARPAGRDPVEVSSPQAGLGWTADLASSEREASWRLPPGDLTITARLEGDSLTLRFRKSPPYGVTWPVITPGPGVAAYVLPLDEGSYVPVDSAEWRGSLLPASPQPANEWLSMPFFGLDCGRYTITYILANPFHNTLGFDAKGKQIGARVGHRFVPREPEEYTVVVRLGGASPVEPARQYRRWLMEQGQFVSLQEKIARTPEAAKLVGAAHVYLWGNSLLSRYDVRNWPHFARMLVAQGKATSVTPGRRLWDLLSPEARKGVEQIAGPEWPYPSLLREAAEAISEALSRPDFYHPTAWEEVKLPAEAQALVAREAGTLSPAEMLRRNALLLEAGFPGHFLPLDEWGDGASLKMMERLAGAGLDRLWLGLDSWQGGFRHPQAVAKAEELGYLIATYDSYESIHAPTEPDTWETAQFDRHLYDTGAVLGGSGQPIRGFQQKGYRLNPRVAWPYVQERVTGLMRDLPERFNSWFIDCDAYGDLEDDYSPVHPMTQQEDMQARLQRMAWIRDTYGLAIGSERGVAYAAPVIHFAHGMMTPVIGWGDPDLQKDRTSPYYLGAWWPSDGPQIILKQVPLKPKYYTRYFDPRYRLPLYETVFHDSVVATHHWQYASLKFTDQVATTELQELLYGVPPLYNLNLEAFAKDQAHITAHYRFFSPLHRELALLPMTDFAWLTPDRLVQRTVFGDRTEVVANFRADAFAYKGATVPARGVLVRERGTGHARTYQPA